MKPFLSWPILTYCFNLCDNPQVGKNKKKNKKILENVPSMSIGYMS